MSTAIEAAARSYISDPNPTRREALRIAVLAAVPTRTTRAYIEAARRIHHVDGEVEIDNDATVSLSSGVGQRFRGAYVNAWVWVYASDKEKKKG